MGANHQEYARLGIVRGELNAIIGQSNETQLIQNARAARDLVKLELQRMRVKRLMHNTGAYTLLSQPEFKAQVDNLKALKTDIDALVASTGRLVKVAGWLGSVLKVIT